jgi:integrase/recombinase XerD
VARGELNQPPKEAPYGEHPQVTDFFAYLRLKNISAGTIERYNRVLGALFQEAGLGEGEPAKITSAQLRSFLTGMQERGLAPSTRSGHVLSLKRFFGFLLEEGYATTDPSRGLPNPKIGQRLPKVLSMSELQQLFAAFDEKTPTGRRDKLFFQLSYAGGLRISEAAHLRVEDIDWAEGALRIVGKGDKERRVYLKPAMFEALQEHIRDFQITEFLFPGRDGGPVSRAHMSHRFKEYVKKSGIAKPATPHSLRHSIAVHFLMGGAPLSFVQQFLGHESLATTGIYLRLTDPMAKEIALRIPTAADVAEKKRKERTIKESKAEYAADLEYWAGFVENVLEWQGGQCDE